MTPINIQGLHFSIQLSTNEYKYFDRNKLWNGYTANQGEIIDSIELNPRPTEGFVVEGRSHATAEGHPSQMPLALSARGRW